MRLRRVEAERPEFSHQPPQRRAKKEAARAD